MIILVTKLRHRQLNLPNSQEVNPLKYQRLNLLERQVLRSHCRRFQKVRAFFPSSYIFPPHFMEKTYLVRRLIVVLFTDPPVVARSPLVIRESFTRNFSFPENPDPEAIVDSDAFLSSLLERTLREQSEALCPSPTGSRKSSIRINTPKSSRQVSAAKPIATCDALGIRNYTAPANMTSSSALTYTPTRGPKLGITTSIPHSRILSLRSPSVSESEVVDYFSSGVISKENSGFTPESLINETLFPLNSKIYRIPSSPTIAKRSSRNKPSKPQRGELYFFEHERQKIEQLVAQSKNRNCTEHQNCTDCIEKEYAYYENKIMSTSMPPERRQQIMKANRSIRNIKNVS